MYSLFSLSKERNTGKCFVNPYQNKKNTCHCICPYLKLPAGGSKSLLFCTNSRNQTPFHPATAVSTPGKKQRTINQQVSVLYYTGQRGKITWKMNFNEMCAGLSRSLHFSLLNPISLRPKLMHRFLYWI